MHKTRHLVVVDSDVATRLVGNVYIVALLDEAANSTSHRDDIVVGVGGEHHHTLGEGIGAFRTESVISIGLTSGPPSDSMLQLVEHFNVHKASGAEFFHPVLHTMFYIVFRG